MEYDCSLKVKDKKITDFKVKLDLEIEGKPQRKELNFDIVHFNHTAVFSSYAEYKIEN